jgi:hypothetical protein
VGRGFGSARCGEIRQSVASYSRAARGSAKTGAFESLALRASCGVDAEKRRTQRAWRCARKSASVDASSREDGTHPPRTALAVETRRVARLFAASMSMPSNPSVAFSYAGPPSRIIVAPRHAPAGQKMPTLGRSVPGSSRATWRNSWCTCAATSDALAAAPEVRHFHSRRVSS